MNPGHFVSGDSKPTSEVPPLILKFIRQLCELVAPDCAGDTIIPDFINVNNGGGGAAFSRKQLKQASKRAAKFARRQATKKEGDVETTKADQNSALSTQVASRLSKSEVLSHLLKQQTLLLVWTLAADGAVLESNSPPSLMIHGYAQSLASFLLTTISQEDSELPSLAFLDKTSSALAWRWIHTLDFCLLYGARIRRITAKLAESLRCLTAPMVTALAFIVHRWCQRQTSYASKVPSRAPRIVVRAAGILTAVLHHELERQRFHPSAANQLLRVDDTWITTTLNNFNEVIIPTGMENPFVTLVSDLCDLVEKESVDGEANKSRWIWAAACLNSLAEIQSNGVVVKEIGSSIIMALEVIKRSIVLSCPGTSALTYHEQGDDAETSTWHNPSSSNSSCSNICERLESSSVLANAVNPLKDWARGPAVLEDSLINLPSSWTATYPSVKSWKCLPVERIYAQDGTSG
ncbi:hypothetical protein ACTXT7_005657 [Hymenolepis weldensis]